MGSFTQKLWQNSGEADGERGVDGSLPWLGDSADVEAYARGKQIGLQKRISKQLERDEWQSRWGAHVEDEYVSTDVVEFKWDDISKYLGEVELHVGSWLKRVSDAVELDDGSIYFGTFSSAISNRPLSIFRELKIELVGADRGVDADDFIYDVDHAIASVSTLLCTQLDGAMALLLKRQFRFLCLLAVPNFCFMVWWVGAPLQNVVALLIAGMGAALCCLVEGLALRFVGLSPIHPYRASLKRTAQSASEKWDVRRKELHDEYSQNPRSE